MPRNIESANQLLDQVDRLHSAPQVIQKVLQLTRTPDFDILEVVACIEKDPALTARILKVVNSSQYGLRHQLSSVRQAASYIGQRSLNLITLTFGLVDTLTRGVNAEMYHRYWPRALGMASVASHLSTNRDDVPCDNAYTAGLLADIGMLVFAQIHGDQYASLSKTLHHGSELIDAEELAFGIGHSDLGAHLLKRWGVPDELVDAVEVHHADNSPSDPLATTVHAANLTADAILTSDSQNVRIAQSLVLAEFNLDTDGFIDLALKCQDEINQNAADFGVSLDHPIDCQELLQEAQQRFAEASMETAIELDSLTFAFEDCSAVGQSRVEGSEKGIDSVC